MSRFWMVRSGRAGFMVDEFEKEGCVAVGWGDVGDIAKVPAVDSVKDQLRASDPNRHPSAVANVAAMIWKFAAPSRILWKREMA